MPTYDYVCSRCGWTGEIRFVPILERDDMHCPRCYRPNLHRKVAMPTVKVKGAAVQGGGPDRFTAEMLGIPVGELPEGLKTK